MIKIARACSVAILVLLTVVPVAGMAQSDTGEWEKQLPNPSLSYYQDLQVVDRETIFGVGARRTATLNKMGSLVRSYDGGNSWNSYDTDTRELRSVYFQDRNVGWVGTDYGGILYTDDGGQSWQVQYRDTLTDENSVEDITRVNGTVGWALKDDVLLRTADGGASWSERSIETITTDTSHQLKEIQFVDPSHGYMIGVVSEQSADESDPFRKASFYTTTDSGNTWTIQGSRDFSRINEIFFDEDNVGWIVGRLDGVRYGSGAIGVNYYRGDNWSVRSIEFGHSLEDIQFLNSKIGWAVGDGGVIIHTIDGGYRWNHQLLDTSQAQTYENLRAIDFVDRSNGWVVGEDGTILHTGTGGTVWNRQTPDTAEGPLYQVDFVNADTGWVVGPRQYVLHTRNGGQTWHKDSLPTNQYLTDVDFVSAGEGWAVGDDGRVYHYKDDTQNSFVSRRDQQPDEIRLQQNYPNPFNPTTRIRFSLPDASSVRLTVYNTLGQKVKTLLSRKMQAGTHTARFNGANLSSGVYIYRLETERVSRSRKMLLVK